MSLAMLRAEVVIAVLGGLLLGTYLAILNKRPCGCAEQKYAPTDVYGDSIDADAN